MIQATLAYIDNTIRLLTKEADSGFYSSEANNIYIYGAMLLKRTADLCVTNSNNINENELATSLNVIIVGTIVFALAAEFNKYRLSSGRGYAYYDLISPIYPIPFSTIIERLKERQFENQPQDEVYFEHIRSVGENTLINKQFFLHLDVFGQQSRVRILIDNCLPDQIKASIGLFKNNLFTPPVNIGSLGTRDKQTHELPEPEMSNAPQKRKLQ